MGWITLSEFESKTLSQIMDEIKGGSPRAVAVVAGAFVEDHLTRLIRHRLVKEAIKSGETPLDQVLRPGGPLGDFGNKISLAYIMGLISAEAWKELDAIRFIRNGFAHKLDTNSFAIDRISSRCQNLTLRKSIKIKLKAPEKDRPLRFVVSVGKELDIGEQELDLLKIDEPSSPQELYVAACQFYIAMFAIIIDLLPLNALDFG